MLLVFFLVLLLLMSGVLGTVLYLLVLLALLLFVLNVLVGSFPPPGGYPYNYLEYQYQSIGSDTLDLLLVLFVVILLVRRL